MKLLTLNIWGGRAYNPLLEFLKQQANTVDIFCFQEVNDSRELTYTRGDDHNPYTPLTGLSQANKARADMYSQLQKVLSDFQGIFHSAQDNTDHIGFLDDQLEYGLASFIRSGVRVLNIGETFVHGGKNTMVKDDYSTLPRNIQYVQIPYKNSVITIINFHGLWNGKGKTDTPERLAQSFKVKEILDSLEGYVILCGDFNLALGTESLAILEEGMINLVREHGIISTRSEIYTKSERMADYILVSPGIDVKEFKVVQSVVSDHLPLFLEFE